MASYTVSASTGERAAYGKTLVASTVDTVTFDVGQSSVQIHNDTGGSAIYFTVDGTTPTVGGATTFRVPAIAGVIAELGVQGGASTDVVKLISSGTPSYSVVGG